MVPVTWWKKIDPRRWGSLLLPVWWPCMGTAGQERYWMGQRRHQLWRLTFLKLRNVISIFKHFEQFYILISSNDISIFILFDMHIQQLIYFGGCPCVRLFIFTCDLHVSLFFFLVVVVVVVVFDFIILYLVLEEYYINILWLKWFKSCVCLMLVL